MGRGVKCNNVRGTEVYMHKAVVSSSREHQQWAQLPCGRIVLASFPQLCLSAANCYDGARIHMWRKVDKKNQHLQIWQTSADGTIALACDQSLCLCISEQQDVL